MNRLIAALTASLDPQSLMRRISEQVCIFTPNAGGAAVSVRTADNELMFVSAYGLSAPLLGRSVSVRDSFQGEAIRAGGPQLVADATLDPRLPITTKNLAQAMNIRSWIVLPLRHNETAIGALSVVSSEVNAFSLDDAAGVASTSDFIAALIGSHNEMSKLLADLLVETPGREPTARFLASLLHYDLDNHDLVDRIDTLLAGAENLAAVFQPIVEVETRTISGFEGLCRFPGDTRFDTKQWFKLAHQVGRGVNLEFAAAQTVLAAARDIPKHFGVSVNLSPTAALDADVQALLLSVNDRRLVVEITEHEPFPTDLPDGLAPLREQGVRIAVDDVGAGFASLTQLLRLQPDVIKIDGELIGGIDQDPVRRAMVASIVTLAAEMTAATVAEAVEDEQQYAAVELLGVRRVQGYLMGRPLGIDEIRRTAS